MSEADGVQVPIHPSPLHTVPRVGVGVFVVRRSDGKFVVGTRLSSHGRGMLQLPGGHLELHESLEACAAREVVEETGIRLDAGSLTYLTATNDVFPDGKHYVTLFMRGYVPDGVEPVAMEPDKCASWTWASWDELRKAEGKFLPLENLFRTRQGFTPSS
ncbi:hypothetical protein M427DRAFT_54232 [Gonapodya prolifera JEL478]|uniref:Nudix hydrolase domain-containing protein n=1 Tax=Gonapodya prolifera (strain JEL478) TaxID=1344416 RepID=A0A139AMT0_GONPJ|nr:hypothetical protein M427DRAFT_54232 [Gonapodya prolifera JEL478]|eukprot:KXS18018.1 hypothetical protein M427DRAFT_54232 [Gonapodya prolifera JEL478]